MQSFWVGSALSRVPEVGQKSAFSCRCCFPDVFLSNVFLVLCSFCSSDVVFHARRKEKFQVFFFFFYTLQFKCSLCPRTDRGRTHTSVLLEKFKECERDRRRTPPHPNSPHTLSIKLLSQCREICRVLRSAARRPALLRRCVYLSGSAPSDAPRPPVTAVSFITPACSSALSKQ